METRHSFARRICGRPFALFSIPLLFLLDFMWLATTGNPQSGGPGDSSSDADRAVRLNFDQKALKKLSLCLLHPPIMKLEPSFSVKESTMYYYLGDVLLEDVIPTSAMTSVPTSNSDPLGIPLKDQLRIELLRQYISSPEYNYLTFLNGSLLEGEKTISQELVIIGSNSDSLDILLNRLDMQSADIRKTINEAVEQYALQKHLNLYQTTRKVLAATYDVTFLSTPPGAVVSYVSEFDWKAALKLPSPPPWRVVVQARAIQLNAGSYRIHIVWPHPLDTGGIEESEYTIDIVSDGILNLKPLRKLP